MPTLGLLHPLADGLTPGTDGTDERAGTGAWQARTGRPAGRRLAAGQVGAVHAEAAARLRQAGWDAVPAPPNAATGRGVRIAAALVPRCLRPRSVYCPTIAIQTHETPD